MYKKLSKGEFSDLMGDNFSYQAKELTYDFYENQNSGSIFDKVSISCEWGEIDLSSRDYINEALKYNPDIQEHLDELDESEEVSERDILFLLKNKYNVLYDGRSTIVIQN